MDPWKFSTEPLPSGDQLEAWSGWFRPVFDVHPEEAERPGFEAEYLAWNIGDITLTWNSAPATRTVRTPWHLRHSPVDHWVITYSTDGATALSTDSGHLKVPAGVPLVWSLGHSSDSRRTGTERLQLYLPRDSFAKIGASLDKASGSALDTPTGRLLAEYMSLLHRNLDGLASEDVVRLRDAIEAMVAAALLPSDEQIVNASPHVELTLMERVRRAVRRNLRSPLLGPDMLCREAAMSRSKLYRVLEREGGVASYIQRCRLSESFAMLCDVSSPTVASIAETLCFADASSFTRAFRREFGIRPSDVRAAAVAGHRVVPGTRQAPQSEVLSFGDCLRA